MTADLNLRKTAEILSNLRADAVVLEDVDKPVIVRVIIVVDLGVETGVGEVVVDPFLPAGGPLHKALPGVLLEEVLVLRVCDAVGAGIGAAVKHALLECRAGCRRKPV